MAVAIWLCFSGGGVAPFESAVVPVLVSAEGVVPAFWSEVDAGDLVSAFFGAAVSFFMSDVPAFWSLVDVAGVLVSAFLGAAVSFFISPVFGGIVSFGLALAGASFAVAGADFSAGAIFSAGAACGDGELGAGAGLWAAANPVLAISKAAEIKNLFLIADTPF